MTTSFNNVKQKIIARLSLGPRERQFAKTGVFYSISSIFSLVSRLLSTFILLRFLGAHDYGLLILAMSVSGMLNGFLGFRAHEGIVRFSMENIADKKNRDAYMVICLGHVLSAATAIVIYAATYIMAEPASVYLLHHPVEKTLIRIYGLVWFFSTFTVTPYSIFLVFNEHALLNKLLSLNYILQFIFPVILLPFRLKGVLAGLILSHCLTAVLFLHVSSRLLFKNIGAHAINIPVLFQTARRMLPFMGHIFLSETLKSFENYFSILVLGYFRTPTDVSYFKIATSYAGLTTFITNSVSPLVFSKLSQLWTDGKKKLFDLALLKGRIYLFLISVVMGLSLAFLVPYVMPVLFGESAARAFTVTYLMLVVYLILNAFSWLRPFFLAIGKPHLSTLLNAFIVCVAFPLSLLLTARFGTSGAALAIIVSYAIGHISLLPWFFRQADEKTP